MQAKGDPALAKAARRPGPALGARLTTAAVVAALCCVLADASAKAAELVSSPVIIASANLGAIEVACHFNNISGQALRVTDRQLFRSDGRNVQLTSNTCGPVGGFALAPRATCTITGSGVGLTGYGCKASVSKSAPLRAAVELRANGRVVSSTPLTAGDGGTSATDFKAISSTAMFGAPSQRDAMCLVTNAGATAAKLKNYEIRSSTGAIIASELSDCRGAPEATIPAGKSCLVRNVAPTPVLDLQCRVAVTRKANIRASLHLLSDSAVLNWNPVR